jgi:hypothetical protein
MIEVFAAVFIFLCLPAIGALAVTLFVGMPLGLYAHITEKSEPRRLK